MTRLTRWALDRPSITILLMLALVGGGLWAARGLGRELIPDIEPPTATVIVIYPGASADEVTNSVVKPIETALEAITEIDVLDVTATASESFAAITLQAEYGTKQDDIRSEIEDQLADVDLPDEANDPEIVLFSFADIPAIVGSISGDIDEAELQQRVQDLLVPELEAVEGVSRIDVAGVREDKIYLKLDPDAMSDKGVSIDAVRGALAANDLSFPAGSLETDGLLTPLQVSHRITTTSALEDLVIGGGGSGGGGGPGGPPSGAPSGASGGSSNSGTSSGSSRGASDDEAAADDASGAPAGDDLAAALPTGPFPIPESVQQLAEGVPFLPPLETTDDLTADLIDQLELLAPDVLRDVADQIIASLPPGGAAALPADVVAALPEDIRAGLLQLGDAGDAADAPDVVQVVVVKPGDTAESIADRLGVDVEAVRGDDGEPAADIEPGDLVYVQTIATPAAGGETEDANRDDGDRVDDANVANVDEGGDGGDSEQIRLGDIAEVVREPEAASSISRSNGQSSLGLMVYKERGANTVKVVNEVEARIEELQDDEDDLGDLDVNLVFEQASFITESLNGVRNEGILGGLFAILVILWFLRSIRATLVIAVSIPLSVLTALVLMRFQGLSLNLLTLSALTIAIGRVVDDAIVVIENTYRNLQRGVPRRQAILQGAGEVATAITAATLVTVAVFLPLGFVGGLTREFFLPFGQTVTYALLASLIVALTVIPLLAFWWLPPDNLPAERETTLQRVYTPILRWALGHRLITLVLATAIFALSLGLIRFIPQTFLGGFGEPSISVSVSLPTGASLETTDTIVRLVEDILEDDDAIEDIETTIGAGSSGFGLFSGGDPAKASILATLSEDGSGSSDDEDEDEDNADDEASSWSKWFESGDREDPADVAERLRGEMDDLNDVDEIKARLEDADEDTVDDEMARLRTVLAAANIEDGKANRVFDYAVSVGSGGGPPAGVYDLQVRGDDERQVRRATSLIMDALTDPDEWDEEGYEVDTDADDEDNTNADGLPIINLTNNLSEARQTLTVTVDPAKAQAESLSTVQVALALRSVFEGQEVGAIEVADDDDVVKLDVMAVYPDDLIADKAALENYMLDAPGGGQVRLGDIAEVSLKAGAVEITRVNGVRAALISGEITDTDTFGITASAMAIIDRVTADNEDLFGDPDDEDEEPPVTVGSGVTSSEQQDSFNDLLLALPISILIVYLIMVLEFGSLSIPFAILFSLPFAATGAFISLAVTGRALSLSSLIGMLMLIGIVVTNAIVLLDFVQQLRRRGYNVHDALIEGGRTRVRPIMMTAVATVIALIPQALGFTEGALLASELATTVIGGLTTSTLLTLVVVPVLYSLFAGMAGDSTAMMPPPGGNGDVPPPAGLPPMPRPPVPAIPSPGPRPDAPNPPAPFAPPPSMPPAGPQPTGGAVPDPAPGGGTFPPAPPAAPASPFVPPSPSADAPPTPPSRQPYEGPEVTWSSRGGGAAGETDVPGGPEVGGVGAS